MTTTALQHQQSVPRGTRRRAAALTSLVLLGLSLALAAVITVQAFPSGVTVATLLLAAATSAWWGVRRLGWRRRLAFGAAACLAIAVVVLVAVEGYVLENALIAAGLAGAFVAAGAAFEARAALPAAARPAHPVLFYNPRSGDGKAERFHLVDEAVVRGVEAVELQPGDDLGELVRNAISDGADALAMAGGDGSQAVVAEVAAEYDLPYACIPAGTRNHFALDLGVDRDDVTGSLDALVAGRERRVDLGDVNGQVFVNNVSLGLYGTAVQHEGYRESKVRTLLQTVPEIAGPDAQPPYLRWTGGDGHAHSEAAIVVVSNNPYRLGRVLGMGTRPRLDSARLGVCVVAASPHHRIETWAPATFSVDAREPVWAGIDGEAVRLDPPLHFAVCPRALRVLIAPHHRGASPAAALPDQPGALLPALVRIARGRRAEPSSIDAA
jgi:diacylglycerol kinase family enzyme